MTDHNQTETAPPPQDPVVNLSVWVRHTASLSDHDVEATLKTLARVEIDRANRYRLAANRRDYLAAHHLLRRALTAHDPRRSPSEWTFSTGAFGKPCLAAGGAMPVPEFSLSHTKGLVACIVSSVSVGIDVEVLDSETDYQKIAQQFFTPTEAEDLASLPPDSAAARFVEVWTLKESFLKAVGCGLSGALDAISFNLDDPHQVEYRLNGDVPSRDWQFKLLTPTPDSRLAIAAHTSRPVNLTTKVF